MKKIIFIVLLFSTYAFSQGRIVRSVEFNDSLTAQRTFSDLKYVDKTTAQTITGQKNFSGLVNFPDSNKTLLTITNPNQAPYGSFNLTSLNFNVNSIDRPNNVIRLGWNIGGNGAPVVQYKGAMADEWESYYDGNGYPSFERHIAFTDSAGTLRRPISIEGRPDNGYSSIAFQFTNFGFRDQNNVAYLQGDNDGWDYHYAFQHRFEVPNLPVFTQVNIDSTGTLNFPYFNADNHFYFGNYHSTFYRSITADTVYANNFVGAGNEIANVFETIDFFTPSENNYLYAAPSRFTVSDSNFTYEGASTNAILFDNSFASNYAEIASNQNAKVEIDLSTKDELSGSFANTLTVTSGYILINTIGTDEPDSIRVRFYKPMTEAWVTLPSSDEISKYGTQNQTYKFTVPADTNYYYITKIEIMFYNGDSTVNINDIDYFLRYPLLRTFANVDKHNPQSFYHRTSWKDYTNTEVAYIDSNGNADFKQLYINGILQTGSGAIGNADSLGALPATSYLLKSDSTIYLTPSDAASAYATVSHTHTEFADTFRVAGWGVMDTVTTGDYVGIKIENNYTIIEVSACTNTGTVTFNIEERGETTPNTAGTDVMTSDLVADDNQQETSTFSNAAIDRDDWLVLVVTSISGDPTIFSITVRGVKTN